MKCQATSCKIWRDCAAKYSSSKPPCAAEERGVAALQPTNTASPKLPPDVEEFICYLIDNCEREIITEEYLCKIGPEYYKWRQLRA
jgi:hypothetical protein